jgi:hypothetical protein
MLAIRFCYPSGHSSLCTGFSRRAGFYPFGPGRVLPIIVAVSRPWSDNHDIQLCNHELDLELDG